jgi:hypothetical protein
MLNLYYLRVDEIRQVLDEMNVGHGDCKTKDQLLERVDWVQGKGIIKALQDVSDREPRRKQQDDEHSHSGSGTGSEGVSSTGNSHGTAGTGISIHNSFSGSEGVCSSGRSWASSMTKLEVRFTEWTTVEVSIKRRQGGGLGLGLQELTKSKYDNSFVIIEQIVDGTPAAECGQRIQLGSILMKVNGEDVQGDTLASVTEKLMAAPPLVILSLLQPGDLNDVLSLLGTLEAGNDEDEDDEVSPRTAAHAAMLEREQELLTIPVLLADWPVTSVTVQRAPDGLGIALQHLATPTDCDYDADIVLVEGLVSGLPAAKCNIQLGSVVTAINDRSLKGVDFEEMPRLLTQSKISSGSTNQQPSKLVKVSLRQPVMVSQILDLTKAAERCLQKMEEQAQSGINQHQEQEQDLSGFETIWEDTEAEAKEAEELRQEQENYLRQTAKQPSEDADHGARGSLDTLGERVVL